MTAEKYHEGASNSEKGRNSRKKELHLTAVIAIGFKGSKITFFFSLVMFLHYYYYFVWPCKGRIKVDFKVQFPFPCYVSKVTLLTSFKGHTWEVRGVTSVYLGATALHKTFW